METARDKRPDSKRALWFILAFIWSVLMLSSLGPLPPLARFFDLKSGIWYHKVHLMSNRTLQGLKNPVEIGYDQKGVPHFFAEDEEDLFFAQGYVMASQRLFQMELASRVTAGRLSEILGPKTLEFDRYFVSLGMRESAQKTLDLMLEEPKTRRMVERFVEGVNAYVATLQPKNYPAEYKILGVKPEEFSSLSVAHMAKSLTYNLSGRSFDLHLTQILQARGIESVLDLFPEFLPEGYDDIIFPTREKKALRKKETAEDFAFVSQLKNIPSFPFANPGRGSNNWAVSPSRSSTGYAILANDTHLGLSLPNIWYETQLTTPSFSVYGVSLAAVPGVILGFNDHIAWATTNGTTDVFDFFEVEFTDESLDFLVRKDVEQKQVKTTKTQEIIKVKGEADLILDVVKTPLGHLLHREGLLGLVADWMGHQPGQELLAVKNLYPAKSYKECLSALETWQVPIQNFICADQHNIYMVHAGRIPQRKVGQGRVIEDGKIASSALTQELKSEFRPLQINPPSGYVLSANQRVNDPYFPYYLGWDFEEPFRAMQIRRRLESQKLFSGADMMHLQNDSLDAYSEQVLPRFFKVVSEQDFTREQSEAIKLLKKWDYVSLDSLVEPTLAKAWIRQFETQVFGDEYSTSGKPLYPKGMRVVLLIDDELNKNNLSRNNSAENWLDDKKTAEVEDLKTLIKTSFEQAWKELEARHGQDPSKWTFQAFAPTELRHVGRFPGFGSGPVSIDGGAESVRGNRGSAGAVYKLVVELGLPKAWIQVPGHNSGDPFSIEYDRFVEDWAEGKMRKVEYWPKIDEAKQKAERWVVFSPAPAKGN